MTAAPGYTPTNSFSNDESNNASGRTTIKSISLDTELANIASSVNAINTNLQLIQRADGNIRDNYIKPFSLSPETRALLATGGNPRGPWADATVYAIGDLVTSAGAAYICYSTHTSSGSIDTSKFMLVASGIYSIVTPFIETLLDDATQAAAQVTLGVDSGTTANKLVRLNGSAQIPAVDGSLLTNIGTGANQLVKLDGTAKLPAVPGTNLTFESVTVTHASNPYIRLSNTDDTLNVSDKLGTLEFFSNDASAGANGVRAKISANSTGTTGAANLQFQIAKASSPTLYDRLTLADASTVLTNETGITTVSSNTNTVISAAAGPVSLTGTLLEFGGINRIVTGRALLYQSDLTLDVDLSTYFSFSDITQAKLVKVRVVGHYLDAFPGTTYAGSAKLFKSWEQIVAYNGTAMQLLGAALIGTAYSSDATNFPAGAVNANSALLVASASSLVLRFKNRTAAAAASLTAFDYIIEILGQ